MRKRLPNEYTHDRQCVLKKRQTQERLALKFNVVGLQFILFELKWQVLPSRLRTQRQPLILRKDNSYYRLFWIIWYQTLQQRGNCNMTRTAVAWPVKSQKFCPHQTLLWCLDNWSTDFVAFTAQKQLMTRTSRGFKLVISNRLVFGLKTSLTLPQMPLYKAWKRLSTFQSFQVLYCVSKTWFSWLFKHSSNNITRLFLISSSIELDHFTNIVPRASNFAPNFNLD